MNTFLGKKKKNKRHMSLKFLLDKIIISVIFSVWGDFGKFVGFGDISVIF